MASILLLVFVDGKAWSTPNNDLSVDFHLFKICQKRLLA